jgi:hypothetical protein
MCLLLLRFPCGRLASAMLSLMRTVENTTIVPSTAKNARRRRILVVMPSITARAILRQWAFEKLKAAGSVHELMQGKEMPLKRHRRATGSSIDSSNG